MLYYLKYGNREVTALKDYILLTDSSCDLSAALANELELEVLPLSVLMGDKEYANYLDEREITFHDFFERIRQGAEAKTSAVNSETFRETMKKFLDAGQDVLYIGFSSGLSATYSAGETAAAALREEYPDRKILTVDSLCASGGQGLLLYLAAKERLAGKSIEEVNNFAEATKLHVCHWFTVDDLHHLRRGGRVSGASAVIGTLLKIKPVLHVDDEGKLIKMEQVKGRKASLLALLEQMKATVTNPEEQVVFINHGDCLADAELLADSIRKALPVKEIIIHFIGPVIGAHTGAGVVALFFLGSKR